MLMKPIPVPKTGRYSLLLAPAVVLPALFELSASLAARGDLRVVDGGNVFNAYRLSRPLRRRTARLQNALAHVQLARTFTCYQMADLLEKLAAASGDAPPTLVLDLLAGFADEGVPRADRLRLLRRCCADLETLARRVPLAVWVRPHHGLGRDVRLFVEPLLAAAGETWQLEALQPDPPQPRLF